jgi:L-ascorbate metabolism protein UlaG (beta-lactamase superfamily)
MAVDITWYGHSCFRLRGRNAAVVTDPYPPSLGPKLKLEADIITVSHGHDNHNHVQSVGKEPFLIEGPGEYEVSGVTILGIPTFHDAQKGAVRGRNTVYLIDVDDVKICHLGDVGHALDATQLERLGNIDVLLVPVGGGATLDATKGAEVVRQVEPRFVLPMHYELPSVKLELQPVDRFLQEMGVAEAEADPQPKLTVHASSSAGEGETKVVVLDARG